MRLKKPVSKRGTTRMREGIKKKAAAHRKKQNKLAKKDPTWKSKHKKDPGIPSSFPYKDRIVNEIEETKRQHAEERERLRELKRQERLASGENVGDAMEEDDDENDNGDSNGLAALLESAQQAAKEYEGEDSDEDSEDEEDLEVVDYEISDDSDDDSELDKSRKAYDKIFKTVVEASDVVLYVLDARDPEGTRSRKVEQAVLQSQGKRLILILNKIDLIPPEVLKKWMDFLKSSFPTIPVKASGGATNSTSFNKNMTQAVTTSSLLTALKSYAAKSNFKRSIIVGVIGYPNVGKSSIINALTSRHGGSSKACPVGNQAGVTTSLREVKIDGKLKVLDSPGIVFPSEKKKSKVDQEAQLALLNALPPKQITDPVPAILLLLKRIAKSPEMTESFKKFYELPPIPDSDLNEFCKNFLIHVARKRGRLSKGGIPNLHSAGVSVLNDWRDGKINGWVLPKSSKESAASASEHHAIKGTGSGSAPSVEQTTIVNEWAKEFDLDGLFATLDNQKDEAMVE
ncbi:NUG1 [Cyberlindnera jadinii]|uniref:NUG1 protein n=1 Tax=Cyberlindnera jadinii (strain ATCC 18201 / CBS 1600 / BCRC 20928 / JCM 3617 / NBRC 0987 / NRRL Y-1542) TaxID=983966 RepID=A0A0H5C6S1_CYBJN|nr:NUG1 [Cyberlindnera jadinii]